MATARAGWSKLGRAALLALTGLYAGCAVPDAGAPRSESFVDRVIEDVSAIVEGMAQAHEPRQLVEAPGNRSGVPAHGLGAMPPPPGSLDVR